MTKKLGSVFLGQPIVSVQLVSTCAALLLLTSMYSGDLSEMQLKQLYVCMCECEWLLTTSDVNRCPLLSYALCCFYVQFAQCSVTLHYVSFCTYSLLYIFVLRLLLIETVIRNSLCVSVN